MARTPCLEKVAITKTERWTEEEDENLKKYIEDHGEGSESWKSIAKNAGLKKGGKSCRLRWVNYLKNDLRRDKFTSEEDDIIIRLYNSVGKRWSYIAAHLPGRMDNSVKNYWNAHLSRSVCSFRRPTGGVPPSAIFKVGERRNGKEEETSKAAMKKKNDKEKTHLQSKVEASEKKVKKGACAGSSTILMPLQVKTVPTIVESEEKQVPCHANGEMILVDDEEKVSELIYTSKERENSLLGLDSFFKFRGDLRLNWETGEIYSSSSGTYVEYEWFNF